MIRSTVTHRRHRRRPVGMVRRAITLIEVLVSIGVLAIGLMGVAALIPLASHHAKQGLLEDRKAAAGRRAYREFQIRGMANPDNWIGRDIVERDPVTGDFRLVRAPYCLDPLGYAASEEVTGTRADVFPASASPSGPVPAMQRVTLATQPGNGALAWQRDNRVTPVPMPLMQANQVFTIEDDLIFTIPEDDDTLPPHQDWLANRAGDPVKRMAEGRFTWFATLVPERYADSDLYRLSIAVTSQRRPEADLFGDPALESLGEQLARVSFLGAMSGTDGTPVAYSGGDVELQADQPIESKVGDWVVLSQQVGSNQYDFRWYRIVAADERAGQPLRQLTLHGPDWRILGGQTWATLVPGVVAVYEKTIRLENSSLWTSF